MNTMIVMSRRWHYSNGESTQIAQVDYRFATDASSNGPRAPNDLASSCRKSLYPHAPFNAISPPLEAYEGTFHHPGYGTLELTITQVRNSITGTSESYSLRTSSAMGFDGLTFHIIIEHVNGNLWIGWTFIEEHSQTQPELCMRVETQLDYRGQAHKIGLDLRQEEDQQTRQLVWFSRLT